MDTACSATLVKEIITHAPVQTTDFDGGGKVFILNMCNPLITIHE